ncbi:MAG: RNA polymerase sigma factor [Acidobacteriota bacterium]|nr:RNA polymerase sigma factor [Acidobacteriota bacterium]
MNPNLQGIGDSGGHPAGAAPPSPQLRQLFDHWYQPVVRFFLKRGFAPEDSQELAQETFLRAVRSIQDLRSQEAVRSWILRIAANVWKNELRYRSADKRLVAEVSLEPTVEAHAVDPELRPAVTGTGFDNPLEQTLKNERIELIQRALHELPEQRQRCLLLYSAQGLKYREIADLMQISLNTVKSHIHQARQQLKERLHRLQIGTSS